MQCSMLNTNVLPSQLPKLNTDHKLLSSQCKNKMATTIFDFAFNR